MIETHRPRVSRTALALGFAGLLPQLAAVLAEALAGRGQAGMGPIVVAFGAGLALVYATVILSFLGGIWWGLAMRRDVGQAPLVIAAIVPPLVGAGLLVFGMSGDGRGGWALVALGSVILLTLIVDRGIISAGEAPDGWMRLRAPLSTGLGVLTIVAGLLSPA